MKIKPYKSLFLVSVIYLLIVITVRADVAGALNDFTEILFGWIGFTFYLFTSLLVVRFFSLIPVYRIQLVLLLLSLSINGWHQCNQQACDMAGIAMFLPFWLIFLLGIIWFFRWIIADKTRI